jgi:D-alanyl-D-alanine carboxypeptidase
VEAQQDTNFLAELGISADALRLRGLQPYAEATALEVADVGSDGRKHLLVPEAASAWKEMKAASALDGEDLFVVSAFRTVRRQMEILRKKLESGQSIEEIIKVSAPPGYSEHHTGLAIDLGTSGVPVLEPQFEATSAFAWLCKNAGTFGFHLSYPPDNPYGYQYEPWHWCHRGAA